MKMLSHPLLGGLGLSVLLLSFQACHDTPPLPKETIKPIKIFTVGESPLASEKEYLGRTEATQSTDLSFRVPGRLLEIPVKQGDRVENGQVIARIDPRDFQNRMESIQSQLDQAKAVLAQMKAGARPEDIHRLEAVFAARESESKQAQTQLERQKSLLKEGLISQQEFDAAKARTDTLAANLVNARQELAIGKKGARREEIDAQEASIRGLESRLQESQDALADTELKSPYAGIIARINANAFEDIQANQPVLTLQDISKINILINISETEMARGRAPETNDDTQHIVGTASFPALGDMTFPVSIAEFQTEANPQTQSFKIVLQMEQPEGCPVKPGMNAVIRGEGGAKGEPEGFRVPVNAIRADANAGKSVWRIDPQTMRVSAAPVETAEIWQDQIQITKGLSKGDLIAVSATNLLREGMRVEQMKDLGSQNK